MPSSLYSFAIQHPTAFKRNTNTRRSAVSTKRAFKKFQKQAQYNDSSDNESDIEYEIQVFEIPLRGRSQTHQSKHTYSRDSSVSSVSSASESECDHDDSEDDLSDAGSVEYMFAPSVIESFKFRGSSKSRGSFGQGKGVWKKVTVEDDQESEEETDSESDEDSESDSDVSIDDASDSDSDSEVDDEEIESDSDSDSEVDMEEGIFMMESDDEVDASDVALEGDWSGDESDSDSEVDSDLEYDVSDEEGGPEYLEIVHDGHDSDSDSDSESDEEGAFMYYAL
ncbi:hypothetical protein HDU79_002311, partial [Rhizoclosmatium sp. JEL0117]